MQLMFNMLLREAGLALADARLLRHKDQRAKKGRTPYELWRDERSKFELYQSTQATKNHTRLNAAYWAAFVGTPSDESLFAGFYAVTYLGRLKQDRPMPHMDGIDKAGMADDYRLKQDLRFSDLEGRLLIDWSDGKRSWIQRADQQDKRIVELRRKFKEPGFPGYLDFMEPLSRVADLPKSWVEALKACKGIYLLTCPKTKEQYVGAATGEEGFWRRWQDYVNTGHGGNIGLKSRDPSDYQVSILEVAGTAMTADDILKAERRWQSKLQSGEMGLNR